MPQELLPLVPHGTTSITDLRSVAREDGQWRYFLGVRPIFAHAEDDQRSFRMFTAQLVCQGTCRQKDIMAAFGVTANSVKHSVKKFREQGIQGFYQPRRGRGATVLKPEVLQQAQERLHRGESPKEVAKQLGVKLGTLRKAINQGRLSEPSRNRQAEPASDTSRSPAAPPREPDARPPGKDDSPAPDSNLASPATDKSQRTAEDAAAADGLGMAWTRVCDRVAASLGLLPGGAATQFEPCRDVTFGGVMCALPALAQNGLFRHLDGCFTSLGGYYTTLQVMTLLGYMALCRIKTAEQLQYESPGELGKLLGLDRVPEVRCLRHKLAAPAGDDAPQEWAAWLSRDWLEADPELAGALYVDGHVRPYHGRQTQLPRPYVARQKLCLRGTTDYWTNDALGQPFFVVERPIDQGLLEVLRNEVVPRLLKDVPGQPTQQELESDPYRHRFVLLFDREGYSPDFAIDLLAEYGTDKIPEPNRPVVNPARRALDSRRRSLQSQLTQRQSRYAALTLHPESVPEKLPAWEHRKAELVEQIEQLEHALEEVKQQQKETPSHMQWEELPEGEKCERLAPGRKRLLDTVKMIAYRAETAMVTMLRETLSRLDDARSLVRDLFRRDADLLPDEVSRELRVSVHGSSNPRSDRAIRHLLAELNATEQKYPGTRLKLTYSLVGEIPIRKTVPENNHRDQEV